MDRRIYSLDLFRIVAAFMVICIHKVFLIWGLNPIYKCAVPFFLMTTGYFIQHSFVLKKNMVMVLNRSIISNLKLLIPALFVYSCYTLLIDDFSLSKIDLFHLIIFNGFGFINAQHLWYLAAVVYVCVFFQLLYRFKMWHIIPVFSLITIIPVLGKYNIQPFAIMISHYDANWILTGLPWLAIGTIIRSKRDQILRCSFKVCGLLLWCSLLLGLYESKKYGSGLDEHSAFYISTPFYSISLFVFLLMLNERIQYSHIICEWGGEY